MKNIIIKKGLKLPDRCRYTTENIEDIFPKTVGLICDDYNFFKGKPLIEIGSKVNLDTFILYNRKNEKFRLNLPVNGILRDIVRGKKRKILSTKIEVLDSTSDFVFENANGDSVQSIIETLLSTGLFTAIRQRPFDTAIDFETLPEVLFINAMQTRPFSCSANYILSFIKDDFISGVKILSKLASKKVYICVDKDFNIPIKEDEKIEVVRFIGPHPAGLTGTHIHYLFPVNERRKVWYIDFQEVGAIGKLFSKKVLTSLRYITVSDLVNETVKIIRSPIGSNIFELLNMKNDKDIRIISGNILFGRSVTEDEPYLGRYDYQITIINEMTQRKFMEWALPGKDIFSVKNVFLSKIFKDKYVKFDTSMHGSIRPIVPVGSYEKVFPFDIEITHLLRYLSIKDSEMALKLGVLELGEEDLSLATFVCPGKNDYTKMLKEVLEEIYFEF
jgi:Na+-transporting NADH:ubiquinone oxidoreductase subunit A